MLGPMFGTQHFTHCLLLLEYLAHMSESEVSLWTESTRSPSGIWYDQINFPDKASQNSAISFYNFIQLGKIVSSETCSPEMSVQEIMVLTEF